MPVNPFTNYNSNERIVALPITSQKCTSAALSAAGTTVCDVITLTAQNLSNGTIIAYVHFLGLYSQQPGAAAGVAVTYQWQFRNAAHANVGAAVQVIPALVSGNTAAGAAAVLNNAVFSPPAPYWQSLSIPATSAEIVLQRVVNIAGAPVVTAIELWGVDPINTGVPGGIGGGGMTVQGANNPNTF